MTALQLPSWAVRSAGYDQYKIYKWKIVIYYDRTQAIDMMDNGTGGSDALRIGAARHCLVADFNDASPPSNWDQMLLHPWARPKSILRPFKMIIRPNLLKMAYEPGVTTGSGYMSGRGWIKTQDSSVAHYGFKYCVNLADWHPATTNTELGFRIVHTVYWGVKNLNCTT